MKLTNHKKTNAYEIDTYVMRGTIEMTLGEFSKVFIFLCSEYEKAVKRIDTYKRDSLRAIIDMEIAPLMSLGVEATRLIVNKYNLKGYKEQNYGIKLVS